MRGGVQREESEGTGEGGGEGIGRAGRFTSCPAGGNVSWYSHYGEQNGGSLKS